MSSNIKEDSVHFVGQASAFAVGINQVTNGDFAADSGWTKGTGWTTAGGDADCDGSAGGDTELLSDSAITTVAGTVYRVQFEVTVFSAGNIVAVFDGVEVGGDKAAVGVYTTYVAATDSSSTISLIGDLNFIGSVDNISVVEWVGDLNAGGGCTIATFTGTLTDYMTATGGVLHNASGLALSDDGGSLAIAAATTWDQTPIVGTLVKCDFSATFADGIYEITAASSSSITIDLSSGGLAAETVEVWVGGAYPNIATCVGAAASSAMADSTLSEDPDGTYRKRYICVNVDNEVDAVTDFVAETSETAIREDDGSRKIIGFYDSISVVQPDAGYRVVSDMDFGGIYYGGARKAFNSVEGFSVINPLGKWTEWNAKGNAINILELNTSNFEMRNIQIHNTVTGASEGLFIADTSGWNTSFVNCWFDTSSRWQVDDDKTTGCALVDCYIGADIESMALTDAPNAFFVNCIVNSSSRTNGMDGGIYSIFNGCLFYKGERGINSSSHFVTNCIFFDQTVACIEVSGSGERLNAYWNNIFSPVAAADIAISVSTGTITSSGFNNIMYSVTAGAVLTNPIVHDQITPNPPLPVGTLEVDPLFVNPADGDFRLRVSSPGINGGMPTVLGEPTTIGLSTPKIITPNSLYDGWGGGLFNE